jgi:GAF domain-containing protein
VEISAPLSVRAAEAERAKARVAADPSFRRITQDAANELGVSTAQISIVTDRVTVAAGGAPEFEGVDVALDEALCTVVLRSGEPLVADNAAADPRLASIEAVRTGLVGGYLGIPLRVGAAGHIVGVLCAYDPAPQSWTAEQVGTLQRYAAQAMTALEDH